MRISIDIPDKDESLAHRYKEIIVALIVSGAFDVRNGKAILHFDNESVFQGVQLDFWAFKRLKKRT